MGHCSCLLFYSSETMIWREKERSRIRVVPMEIRRMDRVPNAWIKELFGMTNGVEEHTRKY